MTKEKIKDNKRTAISSIGKNEVMARLFKDTGYNNRNSFLSLSTLDNDLSTHGAPKNKNLSSTNCRYVTTSVMILEGIDFNLTYTPLKHLGYKSALLAIGALYAKFYTPAGMIFNIGLSQKFCYEEIAEFWTGVIAAAKEHKIEQIGLELNASITGMAIGITATGRQREEFISKLPSNKKNSLICITGNIGGAYMGLHILERERVAFEKIPSSEFAKYKQPDLSKYKFILSQYLSPHIEAGIIEQFKEAGILPSSGYFITKGLANTIKQLCIDSGLGAKIFLEKIPIAAPTFEIAEEIGIDAATAALNGGDDYKFLFVIPLEQHESLQKEFPAYDIIGHLCSPSDGMQLITPDGAALELKSGF